MTNDQLMQRRMDAAEAFTLRLAHEADLRGVTDRDLLRTLAITGAARSPKLMGEVLAAVEQVVKSQPIRKIIGAGTLTIDDVAPV